MDTNEIMVNEEVTEGIAMEGFGTGLKVAAGIGLAVVVGGIAYKYLIKPMVAKIKAKKESVNASAGDSVKDDGEEES